MSARGGRQRREALAGVLAERVATWPDPGSPVVVVDESGPVAATGDVDEPLAWASVTKVATALTVLLLVHDEEVGLDDPAGPPGATLSNLLDHTSGLDVEGERVRAEPGQRRIYSNAGPERAAAHVEQRTGAPFAELLDALVLQPLGMTGTRLDGSPAHALVAPARDMAVLARELLAPRVLPGDVVAALSTPSRPGLAGVLPGYGRQEHNDWGLGAEVRADKSPHWTAPGADPATFGHFGQSGSFLWVDPAARLACTSASREPFGPWAVEAWPLLAQAVLDHR